MKTTPLKGMKDILPREQRIRDYVQGEILKTYRAAGFERISTPIMEDMENLDKSDGGDNLNLIFKVLKRGDKLEKALASGSQSWTGQPTFCRSSTTMWYSIGRLNRNHSGTWRAPGR